MAEYIDREKLIPDRCYYEPYGYEAISCEQIFHEDVANVVEREKIDKAIAEIKDGYYSNEEKSETDSERADAFNNGLSYALEILKRNIGE